MKLVVCTLQRYAPNPHSCGNSGGLAIAETLERELIDSGLSVPLEHVACFGACLKGPNVRLLPTGKSWHGVNINDAAEIIAYIKHNIVKL